MLLHELLSILDKSCVVWVSTDPDRDDGVFLGEVDYAICGISEKYLRSVVRRIYLEYYKAYMRTGISVIVNT